MAPKNSRNSIVLLVSIAFVVGVALALLSMFRGDGGTPSIAGSEAGEAPGPEASASEAAAVPPVIPADFSLQAATMATLRSSEFPRNRPLRLGLILPVPATRFEPLEARIVDEDGRMLKTEATVQGEGKESANLEIETDWLSPGRYLIHLTTQESSHFPLRRYPLEVR